MVFPSFFDAFHVSSLDFQAFEASEARRGRSASGPRDSPARMRPSDTASAAMGAASDMFTSDWPKDKLYIKRSALKAYFYPISIYLLTMHYNH